MNSYWMKKVTQLSHRPSQSPKIDVGERARGGGTQLILLSPDLKPDSRNGCQD